MRQPRSRSASRWRVAAFLATSILGIACGGAAESQGPTGSIVISGSSTVEPISIGIAERFNEDAPNVKLSVDGPGTGDGFELFCRGETDISGASRPIAAAEIATCEQNGVTYLELKVANDGIAVLTSPDNDQVAECLSFSDIYSLVGPESQGFDNWSDANPLAAELGDTRAAPFPDAPLAVTGPGEESGTYDSFVELALEHLAEARGRDAETRPDYQASGDDNVIVQGIQGSDTSLGWVGYAFYSSNQDQLKAFDVAGEDGDCIMPSPATIADNSYPISRPLFIYVNLQKLEASRALQEFVELYVSPEGLSSVSEVGYVELSDEDAMATVGAFEAHMAGLTGE